MKKHYYYFLFILAFLVLPFGAIGQNGANGSDFTPNRIEGLSVYPNPVSGGKDRIFITSNKNLTKKIEFYDVLGKQVYTTVLTGKELDISHLNKGVYILKITEKSVSETRKLIIK
ncbi:MAG: T9SS type A sorting domain-containing protein [Flavobacteriaceae bacterium]